MRTGDIGHFTEDGTVYISDRLKELIKVHIVSVNFFLVLVLSFHLFYYFTHTQCKAFQTCSTFYTFSSILTITDIDAFTLPDMWTV